MAGQKCYERTMERLLKGMPRPRPFGRLVGGRFLTGHKSQHRTPQAVKWRQFVRLKQLRKSI